MAATDSCSRALTRMYVCIVTILLLSISRAESLSGAAGRRALLKGSIGQHGISHRSLKATIRDASTLASLHSKSAAATDCSSNSLPWITRSCCAAAEMLSTAGANEQVEQCTSCAAAAGDDKAYACAECARQTWYADAQVDCMGCVRDTSSKNKEWACASLCYNPALSPDAMAARGCALCYGDASEAAAGHCGGCMTGAAVMARRVGLHLGHTDIEQLRNTCLGVVLTSSKPWAAVQCLKLPLPGAQACLDCLYFADADGVMECIKDVPAATTLSQDEQPYL